MSVTFVLPGPLPLVFLCLLSVGVHEPPSPLLFGPSRPRTPLSVIRPVPSATAVVGSGRVSAGTRGLAKSGVAPGGLAFVKRALEIRRKDGE